MSNLKCEKVELELEINGQKAKFVASTLNLDYVLIDNILYLGLDWYDIIIKDVHAKFARDEAIAKRAEQIVAANAAFEFIVAREYGKFQIAIYFKHGLGYVALHRYRKYLYVQFVWGVHLTQDKLNQLHTRDMKDNCKENIVCYHSCLSQNHIERYPNFVWEQDRFKNERDSFTQDIEVEECSTNDFNDACLHCGEYINYRFAIDKNLITQCEKCGATFVVKTEVIATATHNIIRIR